MQHTSQQFSERLSLLKQTDLLSTLSGIQHGVERESLRINPDGSLAQTGHYRELGSSLTHRFITTDFAESLLEFITPPEQNSRTTLAQLSDTHKFTMQHIGIERLWPMSMPCYIRDESDIQLAYYGESNVGRMKTLYRKGLKNRYGSMMQTISGIHFNFSLPADFWQEYLPKVKGEAATKASTSAAYFSILRNYRRYCWLLPYLYGASPTMCACFLGNKKTNLEFQKMGKRTLFLPYATSLRMSDLGYTNDAQSGLQICYNHIDTYVDLLRKATKTPSPHYTKFAGKQNGEYQQLNSNILQIENELYAPIRPKQPTISLERPTDALADRGVSYVEVRVLDVNPFSPVGITLEQMRFLDVFLLYCLVKPSPQFDMDSFAQAGQNMSKVVVEGRNPALKLNRDGQSITLPEWGGKILDEMVEVAELLDKANNTNEYSAALAHERKAIDDPSMTVSGRLMNELMDHGKEVDNGDFAIQLAEQYRQHFFDTNYQIYDEEFFIQQAALSWRLQRQIEAEDKVSFDEFMKRQFGV
ncbi:glutamate--cysteine ligase [Paraneptunicella aestuarii]|uniref:glutamate--cysteine ligase n=1 Tax=Paraneptunicella aestuarii TaxID=2831148 RepID=UPI001E6491AE|nr:glutamate--cysteine ligase [Paraneptunicella aestuarii]UAA37525.1 glutamate--cysteine ligase [Paraneptunicella aestuarii]